MIIILILSCLLLAGIEPQTIGFTGVILSAISLAFKAYKHNDN